MGPKHRQTVQAIFEDPAAPSKGTVTLPVPTVESSVCHW
jgi:hypothetical protein